jgi:hypothetical protein
MVVPVASNLIPADPVDDQTWEAIIASWDGDEMPTWLELEPEEPPAPPEA